MDEAAQPLILIVDDIPQNLKFLGSTLKMKGYNIAVAKDGKEALKLVEIKLPDIILLDIQMPEMDGFTVCEKLKENPKTKDIPVIFITARTETEDIIKGFKLGAVDYITKPFNAEELLVRVSTQLEVKQSRDLIARQNRELAAINATKDKFFSIIAHDLRSPMGGLLGLLDTLSRNIYLFEKEEIPELMSDMYSSAKDIYDLLENLLHWAQIQRGTIKLEPQNLELDEIINHTANVFRQNVKQKKISLAVDFSAECQVYADHQAVETIVRNLLSNAIKFTPEGGTIEVAVKEKDIAIEVSVRDSGVGMSKEDLEKIFRIDIKHTTKGTANESGSGLGLTLCKELIEKSKGQIWVESEEGKETTFFFSLPKAI